jgi:Family of unknown function (DUF5662)
LPVPSHDSGKFTSAELPAYSHYFFPQNLRLSAVGRAVLFVNARFSGSYASFVGLSTDARFQGEFETAFVHHCTRHDHHLEHYDLHSRPEVPDGAALEMVSDWFGASFGYTGKFPSPASWAHVTPDSLRRHASKFPDRRGHAVFLVGLAAMGVDIPEDLGREALRYLLPSDARLLEQHFAIDGPLD